MSQYSFGIAGNQCLADQFSLHRVFLPPVSLAISLNYNVS